MAVDRVPYLVGGGFEHSAEVMRSALYAATGGTEGITSLQDLQVQPQPVPAGSVRVMPGGATLLNTYGGGSGQCYALRVASATSVPITATGSSGKRSDLIIARIDDPTYQGTTFDPATHQAARLEVITGVPATTRDLRGLNLTYPAIPLARVDIPASTGAITAAMITDLRSIARPRTQRNVFTAQPTTSIVISPGTPWLTLPPEKFTMQIPLWATHAVLIGRIESGWVNGDPAKPARVWGHVRASVNWTPTEASWWTNVSTTPGMRFDTSVADTITIPAADRGNTVNGAMQVNCEAQSTANWVLDGSSFIYLDVEFQERAA